MIHAGTGSNPAIPLLNGDRLRPVTTEAMRSIQRLKLTGAAILVLRASTSLQAVQQLSLAFGGGGKTSDARAKSAATAILCAVRPLGCGDPGILRHRPRVRAQARRIRAQSRPGRTTQGRA